MILPHGHSTQYLNDYKDGKIQLGLGIGCDLDNHLRFKRKQINIILGHDNVGKSYWFLWYMLCLSSQHDLKWCIWMGENPAGAVMRDLIQMYTGTHFKDLDYTTIRRCEALMEHWFTFVDNSQMYNPQQLLDIYASSDADACFLDPFTGLDRGMSHSDNYEFMNKTRMFVNQIGKTLYFSTHPNTESGRTSMIYPQDHQWFGHLKPPLKAHIEGGKPFLNRCDDMLIVHRLVKHPDMKYHTMVDVEKVKDRDTGGSQTELNASILFNFNSGKGFTQGVHQCINRSHLSAKITPVATQAQMNGFTQSDFDEKPKSNYKPDPECGF